MRTSIIDNNNTSGQNLMEIILEPREKAEEDRSDHEIRIWNSTYERLLSIKARMELEGKEVYHLTQTIDAVVTFIHNTKIKSYRDDDDEYNN